jgi:hypothetical protein
MTARKKPTPERAPVTVAELLLALASYPQDAIVTIADPFIDLGVMVGDEYHTVYEFNTVTHYERPDIVVQEVERSHPGDEFAIANEFLTWLRRQSIGLTNVGQGHNETASPVGRTQLDRLPQQFAERPVEP